MNNKIILLHLLSFLLRTVSTKMKTIYLIRHGESEYNVWRKKSLLNFTWLFVKDPMIYDAVLSKRGKQQVIQLKETLREMGLLKKINMVHCYTLE